MRRRGHRGPCCPQRGARRHDFKEAHIDSHLAPCTPGTILDDREIARYRRADRNDWIDTWTIERGALRGELTIHGFIELHASRRMTYVRATYVAENGTIRPVTGYLDLIDPSHMTISVGFPGSGEAIDLYCFRTEAEEPASATLWCANAASAEPES